MPKSRSKSRRSRTRKHRGAWKPQFMKTGMVLPLISRYLRQLIKTETTQPKTRQLLLDSFIYANLVAEKYAKKNGVEQAIPLPKYGIHTYVDGTPAVKGDDTQPEGDATKKGGRRRRRSRRRKSRKSSKSRRKSRRKRKKSRRRRRRR